MNVRRNPFLLAITPAMVLLAPVFAPYLSLQHKFFYHLNGSPSAVLLACLVNIVALWAALSAGLWLADGVSWLRAAFWCLFFSLLPLLVARGVASLLGGSVPAPWKVGLEALCVLGLFLSALLYREVSASGRERLYDHLSAVVTLVSLSWFLTLGQFIYYAIAMRGLNAPRIFHAQPVAKDLQSASAGAGPHPRVVWIIFDELGFDQTFGRRLKNLQLPAFDALAAESTVFTDAAAPGSFTEQVIPALMMGEPARKISFTSNGGLLYQNDARSRWKRFDPSDTVFADALRAGDRAGVAGWHNPYCRLLSPVLDSCFWSSRSDSTTAYVDGAASLTSNIFAPGLHFLRSVEHPERFKQAAEDRRVADLHIADAKALTAAGEQLLRDPSIGFVLIHLPIPHPAGIYDRRHMQFSDGGHVSYVDNLALADRVLASFRNILMAQGAWDSSAVLVMGDHAWRTTMLWENGQEWTAEDGEASHGGAFDPRPVYVVKLPNQHTAARLGGRFETLRTRALLDEVLRGRLQTSADLERWAAQ